MTLKRKLLLFYFIVGVLVLGLSIMLEQGYGFLVGALLIVFGIETLIYVDKNEKSLGSAVFESIFGLFLNAF